MNNRPKLKKKFGQHFYVMPRRSTICSPLFPLLKKTTVVEIGCGDGVLTRAILHQSPCKALQVFEIDPEWAEVVRGQTDDSRLTITLGDVMETDLEQELKNEDHLVMLANLPYNITFPLFEKLATCAHLFTHGMVMVQEEAAQRMASTSGRRYGAISLFLQYHFTFTLHIKVPPEAFKPAPKVDSRLVEFVPRTNQQPLPNPVTFWKFVRACFATPRQTLRNNLKRTGYRWNNLDDQTLGKRAQQLVLDDFITIWKQISQ